MLQLLLGPVASLLGTLVTNRHQRAIKQLELDISLAEAQTKAKIALMQERQSADIAWEDLSLRKSGWRAGWFTLLLSTPMVMCFIPGLHIYVSAGFTAINENVPEWYVVAFSVAVASAFGYRSLVDLMKIKKGVK